jgi:hypothetical protein
MSDNSLKKVLTSKQEILDKYSISDYTYRKFLKMGMPVLYLDGRVYAHTDNIDNFFKRITFVIAGTDVDIEDGD